MYISLHIDSRYSSSDRWIDSEWTVSFLKTRLEVVTGIPPESQLLLHKGQEISGELTLAGCGVVEGDSIDVKDSRPEGEQLDLDTEGVDKFELSREKYEAMKGTVFSWKKEHGVMKGDKVGRSDIRVGDRCQVGEKRGTVRYVGMVPEIASGEWVGVEYDEPLGKHDGSIDGRSYFRAKMKHGAFVRGDRVEIGDFPVAMDEEEL